MLSGLDARAVGLAVLELGGGRQNPGDGVDPAVGLSEVLEIGASVAAGDALAVIHSSDEASGAAAAARLEQAIELTTTAPEPRPVILKRIEGMPG